MKTCQHDTHGQRVLWVESTHQSPRYASVPWLWNLKGSESFCDLAMRFKALVAYFAFCAATVKNGSGSNHKNGTTREEVGVPCAVAGSKSPLMTAASPMAQISGSTDPSFRMTLR